MLNSIGFYKIIFLHVIPVGLIVPWSNTYNGASLSKLLAAENRHLLWERLFSIKAIFSEKNNVYYLVRIGFSENFAYVLYE